MGPVRPVWIGGSRKAGRGAVRLGAAGTVGPGLVVFGVAGVGAAGTVGEGRCGGARKGLGWPAGRGLGHRVR